MRQLSFLERLLNRRGPPASLVSLRMDVRPPDASSGRDSLLSSTLRWISGSEPELPARLRTPLERARAEFLWAMEDLLDLDSSDLLCRAQHARSLRELWHLRSELYTLIARRISQGVANERLARVNQHFPRRAARLAATTADHDAQRTPA